MGITYVEPNVTVAFEELTDSPMETTDARTGEFVAVRKLKAEWDDARKLAQQLAGGPVSASGSRIDDYVIAFPERYRDDPLIRVTGIGLAPFFPEDVKAEDGDTETAAHDTAVLTVTYRSFPSDPTLDDSEDDVQQIAEESIEATTEIITGPQILVCFSNANATNRFAFNYNLTKQVNGFDWIYTRFQMPAVPVAMLNDLGKVNATQIRSNTLGFVFPAETLLYKSITLSRQITSLGISAWKATMRFGFRGGEDNTWNHFFDFSSNRWDFLAVCRKGSTDFDVGPDIKPYRTSNFARLVG